MKKFLFLFLALIYFALPAFGQNQTVIAGTTGGDAGTLNGLSDTQFVRSDQDDTMVGNYLLEGYLAGNANVSDGGDLTTGSTIYADKLFAWLGSTLNIGGYPGSGGAGVTSVRIGAWPSEVTADTDRIFDWGKRDSGTFTLSGRVLGDGTLDMRGNRVASFDASFLNKVNDKDLSTPPGVPAAFDCYIVGPAATDDWAGQEDSVTCAYSAVLGDDWIFITPVSGSTTYVADERIFYLFDGSNWLPQIPRNNLTATVAPTVNDDNTAFYSLGSVWIDGTNDDSYTCLDATTGNAVWGHTNQDPDRLGFTFAPSSNGQIDALGWYETTDSAQVITSGSPATPSVAGFHSHWVLDVSAYSGGTVPLTITGTSVDESSGATTGSDTEVISITATGFYQSTKSWIDASVMSVTGSDSVTTDIIRTTYWDRGNLTFGVNGLRLEWTPSIAAWTMDFSILMVNDDGSLTAIDSVTFANTDSPPRAANGEPGKYKRLDYSTLVEGADKEGIILRIDDQSGINTIYLEMKYSDAI